MNDTKRTTMQDMPGDYLLVSKSRVIALSIHAMRLIQGYFHLVQLINEESRLKRSHRASSDVREHIEDLCKEAEGELKAFGKALSPIATCSHGMPVPVLKSSSFTPGRCARCPKYDECNSAMREYWALFCAAKWNDSSKIPDDGMLFLPKNTFLLSKELFESMDEDFYGVCDKAEDLINLLKRLLAGEIVTESYLNRIISEAEQFLDKTFGHWIEGEYYIAD